MNVEQLDALMAESTREFNELKVKEGSLKEQLESTDTRLKQLQGQYNAYANLKAEAGQTPQTDPEIIEAEPVEEAATTPDPFKPKTDKKEVADASK